jgi:hypothetical protein
MGWANLRYRMIAANDSDRLAPFDGIKQIREVPGRLGGSHRLHPNSLSDNQILDIGW